MEELELRILRKKICGIVVDQVLQYKRYEKCMGMESDGTARLVNTDRFEWVDVPIIEEENGPN